MEKQEVNQRIKEMYLLNANLEEEDVQKERKKFYKEALNVYGNWDKVLRVNGVTKRKIREREKFTLYFILKQRYENHGEEAIRPKNVNPDEIKDRIVNSFKTLKALKDIIKTWNADRVLYELHASFLSGADVERLEEVEPELYEQMLDHFKDLNHALDQYDKRFGVPTIVPEHLRKQESDLEDFEGNPIVTASDDLINMMIKLHYIDDEKDAQAIVLANKIKKEEILSYLLSSLAEAQLNGEKMTESRIKEKNPPMYFAIKAHYQSLEKAFQDITKTLVNVG